MQKGFYGKFAFILESKTAAVFFHPDSKKFYEVTSISEPISKIVPCFPLVIETAIFKFNDKLVCDGIIYQKALLGGNITEGFIEKYNESVKLGTVKKEIISPPSFLKNPDPTIIIQMFSAFLPPLFFVYHFKNSGIVYIAVEAENFFYV